LVVQVFFYIDPATRQRRFIEPRPFKEIAHVLFEAPSRVRNGAPVDPACFETSDRQRDRPQVTSQSRFSSGQNRIPT